MNAPRLSEIAALISAELVGPDMDITAVGSDSRQLQAGALFVAIVGERFDGHDYLDAAASAGASSAMVRDGTEFEGISLLRVADTREGLLKLGAAWRQRGNAKVIGLTGSNGKTTVKEMVAAICARMGSTMATRGNLNNDLGVPLTLCRLRDERYAVIEMGANHPGEIDLLSRTTQPDIALLNNAGRAHLEGFGSEEGVARAKAEIMHGLGPDGVFVFNADDRFAGLWRELAAGRQVLGFGLGESADVRSPGEADYRWRDDGFHTSFLVEHNGEQARAMLHLAGAHNRMNALAAAAAARAAGIGLDVIVEGLARMRPVRGRLCPVAGLHGARVIDDAYNANPDSVIAAIDVLASAPGRRTLVIGDLAELGPGAEAMHAEIGARARDAGIERLLTCGPLSAAASAAFGEGASHFSVRAALSDMLAADISDADSVLVKGSRLAAMDKVVDALAAPKEAVAC